MSTTTIKTELAAPDAEPTIKERCLDYLFGMMSDSEAKAFEAELSLNKPELQEAMKEAGALFVAVAKSAAPQPLSPLVKDRLFERIKAETAAAEPPKLKLPLPPVFTDRPAAVQERRRTPTASILNFIALLLLGVTCGVLYLNSRQKDATIQTLAERVENLEVKADRQFSEVSTLRQMLSQQASLMGFFQSAPFRSVSLGNTPDGKLVSAQGKIFWSESRKRLVLYVESLPQNRKDKDYQLWVIADGKPVGAGVFGVRSEKDAEARFVELPASFSSNISAFAVTEEPLGGSASPTMPILLLGSL